MEQAREQDMETAQVIDDGAGGFSVISRNADTASVENADGIESAMDDGAGNVSVKDRSQARRLMFY